MFRHITRLRLRKSSRPFSFSLVALLVAISSIFAAALDTPLSATKRAQIEKAVSAFMTANTVPAVVVLTNLDGQDANALAESLLKITLDLQP
jgi:hypothetical protein